MPLQREQTLKLLKEHVQSESLRKHRLAVEAVMRAYAKKYGEDEEKWGIAGLLHDFDYEKYPEEHPLKGAEILKKNGFSEDIVRAILGHNQPRTGEARETLMAKCLYAVDELCGFLTALSLVRPGGFEGMTAKSVKKKLKDKSFADNISREDIIKGAQELGLDLDAHIQNVISALQNL